MTDRVTIVGGGLVGALLGVVLAKRGASVRIYERRSDMRKAEVAAGRSISWDCPRHSCNFNTNARPCDA